MRKDSRTSSMGCTVSSQNDEKATQDVVDTNGKLSANLSTYTFTDFCRC